MGRDHQGNYPAGTVGASDPASGVLTALWLYSSLLVDGPVRGPERSRRRRGCPPVAVARTERTRFGPDGPGCKIAWAPTDAGRV